MNKIIYYLFKNPEKVEEIIVKYNLITKNGNVILGTKETIKPKKSIIIEKGYFKGFKARDLIIKDKYFKKKFDKRSKELLEYHQDKQLINFGSGWVETGNYIVKCKWDIWTHRKFPKYEEYKEWKNGN